MLNASGNAGKTVHDSLPSSLQVNKYAKELLAAMSSGMEEKDDPGNCQVGQLHCSMRVFRVFPVL